MRAIATVAGFAGRVGPVVAPSRATTVRNNLRRVTGNEPTTASVNRAFASYVRYWIEALRLPVMPREQLQNSVHCDHYERIVEARKAGRGLIVALPHLGNWDIVGAWLVTQGVPLTVVVEKVEPPELFTWFKDFRSSLGLNVVVNGPTVGTELLGALTDNQVVALLCDRDVDGTGGVYEFFGETTTLPKGPAALALRSGAALLAVGVYEEGNGYQVVVDEQVAVERSGRLTDDVDRITRQLIARLEVLIKRAPEQWHVFQPNWPSDH